MSKPLRMATGLLAVVVLTVPAHVRSARSERVAASPWGSGNVIDQMAPATPLRQRLSEAASDRMLNPQPLPPKVTPVDPIKQRNRFIPQEPVKPVGIPGNPLKSSKQRNSFIPTEPIKPVGIPSDPHKPIGSPGLLESDSGFSAQGPAASGRPGVTTAPIFKSR